jgi:GT2 family glycosyltransferase
VAELKVSVLICTHRTAKDVAGVLASLADNSLPDRLAIRVIVVDNTPDQGVDADTVAGARPAFAELTLLREPRGAKPRALNAGMAATKDDAVLFLDDDVQLDPGWLQAVADALRSGEARVFGGRVLPLLPGPRPAWLTGPHWQDQARFPLGEYDYGEKPVPVDGVMRLPVGANWFARREALLAAGGFDEHCPRCQDTDYLKRLVGLGERVMYVPRATVHHRLQPWKLSKRHFRAWFWKHGRFSMQYHSRPLIRACRSLAGVPIGLVKICWFWLRRCDSKKFFCDVKMVEDLGFLVGGAARLVRAVGRNCRWRHDRRP